MNGKSAGEVFADHSTYLYQSGCFSAEVGLTRNLNDAEVWMRAVRTSVEVLTPEVKKRRRQSAKLLPVIHPAK